MSEPKRKRTAWPALLMTICGGVLLIAVLSTLIFRYRSMETELDRMLIESLTAHTLEAGNSAGELLDNVNIVLDAMENLIRIDGQPTDGATAEHLLNTVDLATVQFQLSYLTAGDIAGLEGEERGLLQTVLNGEQAFSDFLSVPDGDCLLMARPVELDGEIAGVLLAKLNADLVSQPDQHSVFFKNVHSVVAGEDGTVIYNNSPDSSGYTLTDLGTEYGMTNHEVQSFTAAFRANSSGSFSYDSSGGRCYVAWASISFKGWRVVQFSQSASVQIERSYMLQTGVMLVSLAVCALLAVLAWRQRAKLVAEKLRYNTLSEFKDTLLFEYHCADDSLDFTSNSLETLELEDTRLENITNPANQFPVFHPDDIGTVQRVLRSGSSMIPGQVEHDRIRMKKRDGDYCWYRSQYKAVGGPNGKVIRVIGTLTDISTQIVQETELRRQAQQDPLTGLYNRAGVKLINARLEQISRGVLFMIDMDDFKSINDNYGHAAGDRLLTAMAHLLAETFRSDDIVARVGGDEFVAFLSGSNNEEMARQKAHELLDRVHNLRLEGIDTQASISVGAAAAPDYGRSYEELSAAADEMLYKVKNGGKGGFALKGEKSPPNWAKPLD